MRAAGVAVDGLLASVALGNECARSEARRLALVSETISALAQGLGGVDALGELLAEGARESESVRRRVMRALVSLVLVEGEHGERVRERAKREALDGVREGTAEGLRAMARAVEEESEREALGVERLGLERGLVGALADGMEGLAGSGVLGVVVRELERRGVEVRE